jgi:hypothetical protein
MQPFTVEQARAARAFLLGDAAGFSFETIRDFENSRNLATAKTLAAMRNAFQKSGVEFHQRGRRIGVTIMQRWQRWVSTVPHRLAQRKKDWRGLRLIYVKMTVSSLVQNNRSSPNCPRREAATLTLSPGPPPFGAALLIRPPHVDGPHPARAFS